MCGIAAYFGNYKTSPNNLQITKCINLMKNRGPDHQDYYTKLVNDQKLVLINSRLKILDKSNTSNQPMADNEGVIVFNGLIYNYLEIKKKLESQGEKFKTKSDTEVLLKLLNKKWNKAFDDLDGMWSFVYYNFKKKNILISRDRFGEKPLFFLKKEKSIFFGSTPNYIRLLANESVAINYKKINELLSFGPKVSSYDNETLFSNIKSLESKSFIEIDNSFNFITKKYWFPEKINIENKNYSLESYIDRFKNIFDDSFKKRVRSDYPIACLLSGGIDSSIVAYMGSKYTNNSIKYYSIIGKNKKYNENFNIFQNIKILNCSHKFVDYGNHHNIGKLENIIENSGLIMPTLTWMFYSFLLEKISKDQNKTVLVGNGGDELFAGYYTHQLTYLQSIKNKKIFNFQYQMWRKFVKPYIRSRYLNNFKFFLYNQKKNIDANFHHTSSLKKFLNFELDNKNVKYKKFQKNILKDRLYKDIFFYTIPGQLINSDNISMYYGIENRSPFLSKDLYEFAFKLPNEFLINNGFNKYILRKSFSNFLPTEVINQREKIGFFGEFNDVFDFKNQKLKEIIFDNKYLLSLINEKETMKLLKKDNSLNNYESHFLFTLLNLGIFLNKFSN
jgi:asparagine synthase (glutamine-hydrolysing)